MRASELLASPEDVLRVNEEEIALQRAIALVKMRAPGITVQTEVQSPCISVCRMSDNSGLCMGCFRTGDEIAGWSSAGDHGKRGIWKLIEQRMDGLLPSDPNNPT
jgi:predicted Fe-S protein YdhL (DUF1289 family)